MTDSTNVARRPGVENPGPGVENSGPGVENP